MSSLRDLLNSDGTVNQSVIWKFARERARIVHKRGYKDFNGRPFSYRETFSDALNHYREEARGLARIHAENKAYEAELAKGAIDAEIAHLARAIEIHEHAVSVKYDLLEEQRLKLRNLKDERERDAILRETIASDQKRTDELIQKYVAPEHRLQFALDVNALVLAVRQEQITKDAKAFIGL